MPVSVAVTPAMPLSPASITPSLSRSSQTRPPMPLLFGISAKLLPVESAPEVTSGMALIIEGSVATGVTVPPVEPAVVMPLTVPAGCVGSVTV